MRKVYRICGGFLLLTLPALGNAQSLCEDLSVSSREQGEDLIEDTSLYVDAGEVDLQAYGRSELRGGVRLRFGRQILLADDVEYDQPSRQLSVDGETFFESDAIQVKAQNAHIQLDQDQARFGDARYIAFAANARGEAGELAIDGPGQASLKDVRYTSCPEDKQDWVLLGDEIRLDSARGIGSVRNARLRFKGVPLFWLPLFYFPVGEQRQSGFLAPRIGDADSTGLDIRVPFYWNIAPNYDLTLTPRYMAQRGEQLSAGLRYLWAHSEGRSLIEYLHEDEDSAQERYLLATQLKGGSSDHWIWQAELVHVSDRAYLTDLDSEEADEAQSLLPGKISIHYRDRERGLNASLGAAKYQSLVDTSSPYARLPEFQLSFAPLDRDAQLRPSLHVNSVQFRKDDALEALRSDAQVALDWRAERPQGYASAHASYRWTDYRLEEIDGRRVHLQRELPTFQTDLGLHLIRFGRGDRYQTLSPQVTYLYVPERDQDAIPIFDTSLPDFSFDQLFARNRFTGLDRIADADLFTTAVRTDWYADNGRIRRLSAKLGVQWRLRDSIVSLPNDPAQASGSSDWLGELDYQISSRWRVQAVGQWNAEENRMDQGSAAARYQRSTRSFMQLSYRFRRGNFEQIDALAALPLGHRWRAAGRWTYSLEDHRSLEALGGLEYRSCCWAAQFGWRRNLNGAGDQFNSAIFLQLELNGLGRIGEGLDRLLDRDIL